jgi:hypothetical protein
LRRFQHPATLPTEKNNQGHSDMTACSTIGKSAPYPLALKPNLTFITTPNGIIATQNGVIVAWILAGHHHGIVNKRPHSCHFVEVVYRRKTLYGVNLETFDATSIEQAQDILISIFASMTQYSLKPSAPKRVNTLLPLSWLATAQGGV